MRNECPGTFGPVAFHAGLKAVGVVPPTQPPPPDTVFRREPRWTEQALEWFLLDRYRGPLFTFEALTKALRAARNTQAAADLVAKQNARTK